MSSEKAKLLLDTDLKSQHSKFCVRAKKCHYTTPPVLSGPAVPSPPATRDRQRPTVGQRKSIGGSPAPQIAARVVLGDMTFDRYHGVIETQNNTPKRKRDAGAENAFKIRVGI